MSEEKFKCYEITPGNSRFDSLIVKDDGSWKTALSFAEDSLEGQFLDDKEWDEISVTIKCVYKTQKELDELETE